MATVRLPAMLLDFWREEAGAIARSLMHAVARRATIPSLHLDLDGLSDERLRDIGLLDGRGPSLRRPECQPGASFSAPGRSASPNDRSTGAGWRFRR